MSNHEPSQSHGLSPRAMADRLFARFVAMYGAQKVGAMWADADVDAVRDTWAGAIGRFSPQSIAVAVRELVDSGREWPPTLPEFVELCRRGALARQQSQGVAALPAPGQTHTSREDAGEILGRIGAAAVLDRGGKNPREWAHRIIRRHQAGEPVPAAALMMARTAVDAPAELA